MTRGKAFGHVKFGGFVRPTKIFSAVQCEWLLPSPPVEGLANWANAQGVPVSTSTVATTSVCDIPQALEAMAGDRDILAVLATMFLTDLPLQLSLMEGALSAGAASEVAILAHRLRGSFSTFRACIVCDQLIAMEQAAQQGDLTAASDIFEQLQPQIAKCEAELANCQSDLT